MGAGLALYGFGGRALFASTAPTLTASSVNLSWLGGAAPQTPSGISWGVPWTRGAVPKDAKIVVRTADGRALPTQSWPLAYWPDGSLKWSGLAIAADGQLAGPFTAAVGSPDAPPSPIVVKEDATSVEISTGPLVCVLKKSGANLIESLTTDGREVGRNARLIARREDRSDYDSDGVLREQSFVSRVTAVTVEQNGPVRAVVKIEGTHAAASSPGREWLPFCVRVYFTAGLGVIRIVHSFVFDGDETKDFISGLGIAFTVPFREEKQNRHVRFAADGDGVWAEPVMMIPGYRAVLVKDALAMNQDQLLGKRVPNLETLDPKTKDQIETVAVWDSFRLNQLAPDSFSIDKRAGGSWLHVLNGNRSRGLAFLGDVSGGLAVASKYFWQKYPAALEITHASADAGEMKLWFWSPDAPAMDLRRYDPIGHDGKISYEDFTEGFGTPNGVANTQDLTLWATGEVPDNATIAAMAKTADAPPLIVCEPQYYQATRTLGVWSLPDHSSPDGIAMEEQLDRAFLFYQGEAERRKWYGFWDYGDVMRTYSATRHSWLYDIGGHAWDNTELMPNAWLWFGFLRSGNADIFHFAEAMTRNTSEVDVYHSGKFVGLGSRHNVNHWGCGAKEARISESWLKRFYYYLTTDERTGDLMRETLNVDKTIGEIQPLRKELVRADVPYIIRIGPDWMALASDWMTEWERTGDPKYRDYVLTGMKDIGAMPDAFTTRMAFRYDITTKHLIDMGEPNLKAGEFLDLFGGDQIAMELIDLIDCPEFAKAWGLLADKWGRDPKWKGYTKMRMMAYAAKMSHDETLKAGAQQLLVDSLKVDGHDRFPATPDVIQGPLVAETVDEIVPLDTPGVSQWALNVLTTAELIREFST